MKRIPIDRLRPTDEWLERAAKAQQLVTGIAQQLPSASQERMPIILQALREAISKYSTLWSDIKEDLAALSFGKCWYCESRENRSDLTVDHFRPKNKVKECSSHYGYWWLAFCPLNYRYACDLCNSFQGSRVLVNFTCPLGPLTPGTLH